MLDPKFTVMLLLREGDAGRITWQHGSVRCLVAPALFSQQIGKKKAYINYVIFGMLQREPLSIITGDASAEGTSPIRFIQLDKTPCG